MKDKILLQDRSYSSKYPRYCLFDLNANTVERFFEDETIDTLQTDIRPGIGGELRRTVKKDGDYFSEKSLLGGNICLAIYSDDSDTYLIANNNIYSFSDKNIVITFSGFFLNRFSIFIDGNRVLRYMYLTSLLRGLSHDPMLGPEYETVHPLRVASEAVTKYESNR